MLAQAREEFGEQQQRSSEPDLIISTDNALFFIEAKLTATNKTTPSDPINSKRYLTGGNRWYQKVFKSDYETIAVKEKKYESMRFWLLGSWMADQMEKDFYLVNLVMSEREMDIEDLMRPHINLHDRRNFLRLSWEEIFRFVSHNSSTTKGRDDLLDYFENKTIGYNRLGKLQRAFSF